ncbi:MAG: hypothetical protein PVS3B2_04090 [Candidatus Dormibacteraceae bacterium]
MKGGRAWSALLVILLTLAIARSTVTASWVPGMDVVPLVALGGALLTAVLAVLPIRWPVGLAVGTVVGPIVAGFAAWPAIHAAHRTDSGIGVWWTRLADGTATFDPTFDLFLICWLMWVAGAWLSWCVLRWRQPMLGLVPGAAAFAANLLNYPRDQNGYNFTILVLTLALLLWTNYTGSIASAARAHVKLTGDARWDFWESGLVAMAAVIVIAILLPPISTLDRTTDAESSMFSSWAQFQQSLSHPSITGTGTGGPGTTGFAADVPLGGPLIRTKETVFTYTGDFSGPRYFRGLNMTTTSGSTWQFPGVANLNKPIPKNHSPIYGETYQKLALTTVQVSMVRPPGGFSDIIFYPGDLYKVVDRDTVAMQVGLPEGRTTSLTSIDRLSTVSPTTSKGKYTVIGEYSTATVDDLQSAGTNYPAWVQNFRILPAGYRTSELQKRIHDLAVQKSAGATNPYDQAAAIESYLRDPKNFSYTLTPPTNKPPSMDWLDFFLFRSKKGYCEFFATAMGDMLRSLGIPTRLVNGFGSGQLEASIQSYVVRGQDAHTWVEAYFPGYGWIPFEPTPDVNGGYGPIPRGSPSNVCLLERGCDGSVANPADNVGAVAPTDRARGARDPNEVGGGQSNFSLRIPDAGTVTKVVAVLFAIVLVLVAGVARYLRPRSVMGVWKRTLALASLAGAKIRPGETPLELGRRMQQRFPEASGPVGAVAAGFAVAAYAPRDEAATARSSVMEAWSALRPFLVRRVLARLRPNRS